LDQCNTDARPLHVPGGAGDIIPRLIQPCIAHTP
jgi:hypothetical protein